MTHRALIPIPQNVDPVDTRCIQFTVPLDSEWVGMFFGALYQLTAWNSYDRDDDHTAKDIADRWKTIVEDARGSECGESMSITFRQTDCLLEYSLDSGATWETAYDGMDCLTAAIADGVILGGSALDDAIASGKISPGQQQGPTSAPGLGFCKDFYVTLSSNQKWICPVPIKGYYTIQVEDCRGGWTPDPTHYWYCPSGETYTFGGCAAGTGATDSGDPLNTVNHMRLVGNYGTTWIDLFDEFYIVPGSVTTDQQLYIQANDSDISNNLGSVTFHITICQSTWTHVFNFLSSDGGFSPIVSGYYTRARYVAGSGWHRGYDSGDYSDRISFYINTPGGASAYFTTIKVFFNSCTGLSSCGIGGDWGWPYPGCASPSIDYTINHTGTQLIIDGINDRSYDPFCTRIELSGLGVDPWA